MSNTKSGPGRSCAVGLFAAPIALVGCAEVLGLPDDPVLAPADRWQCSAAAVSATPPQRDKAKVTVRACNFISTNCATPATGLTASLCEKRDFNCAAPLQQGITDVDGDLNFEVPTGGSQGAGFDGYLKVTASPIRCAALGMSKEDQATCRQLAGCDGAASTDQCKVPEYIAAALFFNPPVDADREQPLLLPLIPFVASTKLVAAAGGTQADMTSGAVFATVLGCDGKPSPGVTLSSEPNPRFGVLYAADGVISAAATATDQSGLAGLLGVPTGFARIVAYEGAGESRREVTSVGVQVALQTMTYVTLLPPRR